MFKKVIGVPQSGAEKLSNITHTTSNQCEQNHSKVFYRNTNRWETMLQLCLSAQTMDFSVHECGGMYTLHTPWHNYEKPHNIASRWPSRVVLSCWDRILLLL